MSGYSLQGNYSLQRRQFWNFHENLLLLFHWSQITFSRLRHQKPDKWVILKELAFIFCNLQGKGFSEIQSSLMVNSSGETIFSSSFILTEVKPTALSTQLLFEGEGKKEKKRVKCNLSPAQSKCLFCRPWKLIAISVKRAYLVRASFCSRNLLSKGLCIKFTSGGLNPSGSLTSLCHLVCSKMWGSSMLQSYQPGQDPPS